MKACLQLQQQFSSRENQLASRFKQQNEKSTSNPVSSLSMTGLHQWSNWYSIHLTYLYNADLIELYYIQNVEISVVLPLNGLIYMSIKYTLHTND